MELLERGEALAALAEARDAAARGAGRAVLVSGEPGIGKSTG
jgi:predicted ATPase